MLNALLALAVLASAQEPLAALPPDSTSVSYSPRIANLSVLHAAGLTSPVSEAPAATGAGAGFVLAPPDTTPRPKAIEYSDAYYTRFKIHQITSYVMVPLFVTQYFAGKELYDHPNDPANWAKNAHGPLAATLAGLFAVNTVTGVWNLWDGRKDPNGRTRRWVHGISMLVADAGFVAVAATAPENEGGGESEGNPSLHRNLAIGSMAIALGSGVMMLLWKD